MENTNFSRTKIIGIGNGGGQVLGHLMDMNLGIQGCLLADTCGLRRKHSIETPFLLLGPNTLKGEGAGGNPEYGARAAEESKAEIEKHLEGVGLLVLVAGLSGGTGSGATPVIARIAKEMHIKTVCFVSLPFEFEGPVRAKQTQEALPRLRKQTGPLNVIPGNFALKGYCYSGDYSENLNTYFQARNVFMAGVVADYVRGLDVTNAS